VDDFFEHFFAAGGRANGGHNFGFVKFSLVHDVLRRLQVTQSIDPMKFAVFAAREGVGQLNR
jgi:hypothetical protein